MRKTSKRCAFSLLELLAVVVILGIIAVLVIPRITLSSATAKQDACYSNKTLINKAVEEYNFTHGAWPINLSVLDGSIQFPDGIPPCPVSGNTYVIDPTTHRVQGHTAGSH